MINGFFEDLRNWWTSPPTEDVDYKEFKRLESKHTRVRHDEDLQERIRVH